MESGIIVHMTYIIEGSGALVNEKGEETPLKAGDFALDNPDEKHQYRNEGNVNVNFTGIINPGDMNEYNSG